MNKPSYIISIPSFNPLNLINLLDSIISHNIYDNFIFLSLRKNDFVKLLSTLNNYSNKINYQHLILENFISIPSQEIDICPNFFLLSFSLFLLKDSFPSLIHIQPSFTFNKNISIDNLLTSFNTHWTLFCENSISHPITSNFFSLYTPLQQKLLNLKIQNTNPSIQYPLHFYHSHHLNTFFEYHNFTINTQNQTIAQFSSSPNFYIHYLFYLILHEQIIIYNLSENFDNPKSIKLFLSQNNIKYHS